MALTHHLHTSMVLPRPREAVFAFFADAENLERITPEELRFRITRAPAHLRQGARLHYRLALFGVPFKWKTEITRWEPPVVFTDEQTAGPYRAWRHTHTFAEVEGGTRMDDHVEYQLPLSPLGEVAFPLVRLQLRRIFAFRECEIRRLLAPETRRPGRR